MKKRIIIIACVIIAVLVVIPSVIVLVNKKDNGKTVTPLGYRVSETEADELAKELFAAKNLYIGDAPADSKILSLLNITAECGDFTIELKTNEKPYRLTLVFASEHNSTRDDWFEDKMVKYSCVLLALISNADEIGWSYPPNETGDTGGFFTRADAKKLLGVAVSQYSSSAESVQLLLNEMGVEG